MLLRTTSQLGFLRYPSAMRCHRRGDLEHLQLRSAHRLRLRVRHGVCAEAPVPGEAEQEEVAPATRNVWRGARRLLESLRTARVSS